MTPEQLNALERLAKLKEQGILTQQELDTEKAAILYGAAPPPVPTPPTSQPEQSTPPPDPTPAPVATDGEAPVSSSTAKVLVIAGVFIAVFFLIMRLLFTSEKGGNNSPAGTGAKAVPSKGSETHYSFSCP